MSKPTAILRPLGLATVLAVGFAVVYAMVIGWGISMWEGLRRRENVNESLVVRADGTPLVERYCYGPYQSRTFHTLEGRLVDVPINQRWHAWLTMPREHLFMFPLKDDLRVVRFTDYYQPQPAVWCFIHDGAREGHGYFVGHDVKSKRCIGYISRDGFQTAAPAREAWFPLDGVKLASGSAAFSPGGVNADSYLNLQFYSAPSGPWRVHMISGDRLLEIDLRSRTVATVLKSPDLISLDTLNLGPAAMTDPRLVRLVVRTSQRVLLLDGAGKQVGAYVIPPELRDGKICFYDLHGPTALLNATHTLRDHTRRERLLWIDASGRVVRQTEFTLAGSNRPYNDRAEMWQIAAAMPIPVGLAGVATCFEPLGHLEAGAEPNYRSALRRSLAAYWPGLLATGLLSAVLAGLCYRRQRRFAQPWTAVWIAMVFLVGPAGLIGYLFHRRWPALERCPACGRLVPRDREACSSCLAEFPPPTQKGTEVFA